MKVQLADGLSVPLEVVTEVLAFLGRRGQGKSYAAQRLAELLHEAGAQFVTIDQVGIWWGLRLAANGKDPGIPIPVLGGLHGDIPLESGAGRLVADLVADRGTSLVLDVSQFESDRARNRFIHDFVDRFYFRRKSSPAAVHVFLEECQECVPQNPAGDGEKDTLHVIQRLVKLGRNYGIGVSLISQRPQEVHKKVLNLAELLFAFQLTGKHERRAVVDWIEDKAIDEDIDQELPRLERGHPHAWSPAWLKVSKVVEITSRWTFDASVTPKVGVGQKDRDLSPIDLADLQQKMAATIERAKAEDPRELRRQLAERDRRIRELERAATSHHLGTPVTQVMEKRVEVPVLKEGELGRAEKVLAQMDTVGLKLGGLVSDLAGAIRSAKNGAGHSQNIRSGLAPATRPLPISRPEDRSESRQTAQSGPVSGVVQRILDALAELEAIGAENPPRPLVALLAGYTHLQSKGFVKAVSSLRMEGLVEYGGETRMALTPAGRSLARIPDVPRSPAEVQDRICRLLGGASERILRPLIEAYPGGLERHDLAERAGYGHLQSKGFVNAVSRLRTLGFIDYAARGGPVLAQPVLFLETARPRGVS